MVTCWDICACVQTLGKKKGFVHICTCTDTQWRTCGMQVPTHAEQAVLTPLRRALCASGHLLFILLCFHVSEHFLTFFAACEVVERYCFCVILTKGDEDWEADASHRAGQLGLLTLHRSLVKKVIMLDIIIHKCIIQCPMLCSLKITIWSIS